MPQKALYAALLVSAVLVTVLLSGCGEAERAITWDQLDSGFRAECAPSGDEAVLHAWKGGKRYCFRYTIERTTPERKGPAVIVARAEPVALY